jgi:Porin PorA
VGRRAGFALVFVGLFLLFFALLVRFYAYPRLQKAPLDQYSKPVAVGTGTYFNRAQLKEVHGAQLQNVRVVRGDVRAGSADTAVWDSFNSTTDLSDGGVITASQERAAFDRVNAMPKQCCGENPPHQGLIFKFPFNTKKQTYPFWDLTARKQFPARFMGEERLLGLTVYRFEQQFSDVQTDSVEISGEMAGEPDQPTVTAFVIYGNHKTLWVEPRTGQIIKASQDVNQVLQTPTGKQVLTVADATLTYDDATVRQFASEAKGNASQLSMLSVTLPVGAAILGLLLLLGGFAAAARPPGRRVASAGASRREAGAV